MNQKMDVARNQERSKKLSDSGINLPRRLSLSSARLIDPPRFVDSGDATVQRSHSGTDSPHRVINSVRNAAMLL